MDSGVVCPGLILRESNNPCARPSHIDPPLRFRRGADGASLYGVSICGSKKDYYYYIGNVYKIGDACMHRPCAVPQMLAAY
jgi:hypothetical protein